MRVVVTIQHPAHVHFFRYPIEDLEAAGHDVHVFARENEVATDLLDAFGIEYEVLAGESASLPSLAVVQAVYETRLLLRALRLDPDVLVAIGGVAASHVAAVVGARSVVFYDTEHATLIHRLAYPFADTVCTPECYQDDLGDAQVRYPGFHELSYLHPDRFTPDEAVLDEAGLADADAIAVCRFSSWDSSHDVGQGGFDDPVDVVERLEAHGASVRLSSEVDLPAALDPYRLDVAPERMHDLLYHADLALCEGATTAAESALLATPAVYVNSLSLGYIDELAAHDLLYQYNGPGRHERGLERATDLLERDAGDLWRRRRDALLAETRDPASVVVDQVLRAGGAAQVR